MKRKHDVKKLIVGGLCAVLLVGTALAAGLSKGDSLISLSYLEQIFIPKMVDAGAEQVKPAQDAVFEDGMEMLETVGTGYLTQAGVGENSGYGVGYARQAFSLNDELVLNCGSGVLAEAGSVKLTHNGVVVDVTTG